MNLTFETSSFVPIALGFFGLGTGYLIYGPQELFGWPKRDERVDRSTGIWGIWMPGFCQLATGTYLFVGLTWFQVFKEPPLYMAALAFSAYGFLQGGRLACRSAVLLADADLHQRRLRQHR